MLHDSYASQIRRRGGYSTFHVGRESLGGTPKVARRISAIYELALNRPSQADRGARLGREGSLAHRRRQEID